jgi:hypothetical protein
MAFYADTPEGRRFVERVKGYFEAAKDRIDLAAIRDKMVKELKRAPNITDDEKARIEDGIFTMHGEVLRRKELNMKSKNSLTDLYSQSVKVAKKYPRDSFEFKAQERLAAEFWKNFTEAERKELERLGYFARNTIVSTNAVVAKALAMNGWDSKMGWEFESKIESAIKSELGTVTDVGAAFKDGGYDTGGSRNGAISVGLYDDKARKNVGRIKQIVEKILKQYGGGRITSQKVMKLAGEDAVEFTVVRNSRAMNAALKVGQKAKYFDTHKNWRGEWVDVTVVGESGGKYDVKTSSGAIVRGLSADGKFSSLKAVNASWGKAVCNDKNLPLETTMKEEFRLLIRYKREIDNFLHATSYVIERLMDAYKRVKAEGDKEAEAWAQKFAYKAHELYEAVKKNKIL